ncbi:MAG TPA: hypothetical protein GYA10_15550 [Alphaproteobacteria bacterium]|nr:hypothetical protein [Alphaproteobacteria bacterium]
MEHGYRGHLIRLVEGALWSAELIDLRTGTLLPTSASATPSEGLEVCAERARDLVDLYLEGEARLGERHGH